MHTRKTNQIKVTPGRDPSPVYSVFCILSHFNIVDVDVVIGKIFSTYSTRTFQFVYVHLFVIILTGVKTNLKNNTKLTIKVI